MITFPERRGEEGERESFCNHLEERRRRRRLLGEEEEGEDKLGSCTKEEKERFQSVA